MKRDHRAPEPELEELFEHGRTIRPLPDVVRARALARARATVAAAAVKTPRPAPGATASTSAPAATAPGRGGARRIAIAASIALLIGGAGAVAALRARTPDPLRAAPPSGPSTPTNPRSRVAPPDIALPSPADPESTPAAKVRRPARVASAQESYRAELDLLQRAQVAFASRDFAGALVIVAEHARRFPNGRLAEEREALRIRSLVGSGREDAARRATAAFANRFPRSVLLPRLRQSVNAPE